MPLPDPSTDPTRLLAPLLGRLTAQARELDRQATFPAAGLDALRSLGLLVAPVPPALGGLGWGTAPAAATQISQVLRLLGRACPSLGRVYEGHVNAIRLICRYGSDLQAARTAADAAAGHLFALWSAEHQNDPVRLEGTTLSGRKSFASAAGHATRALITAAAPDGEQMVLIDLPDMGSVQPDAPELHGMRSAGTRAVRIAADAIDRTRLIGGPGDYMRQPEISLGAWRTLAVIVGLLESLIDALRSGLAGSGRADAPAQRARLAEALVARQTAVLWLDHIAPRAEAAEPDEDAAGMVKLARLAITAACEQALRLVPRSLGLAALRVPHPAERLGRDLATYLRQPALDEVADEAAAHFLARELV